MDRDIFLYRLPKREPLGFGEHTRGLSGEYAHEMGWQMFQEERTHLPEDREVEVYEEKRYEAE